MGNAPHDVVHMCSIAARFGTKGHEVSKNVAVSKVVSHSLPSGALHVFVA